MNSIVFIESNTSGTGKIFLTKAVSYGYIPIFLTINPELYPFLKKIKEIEVYKINTMNLLDILEICEIIEQTGKCIKGVFSCSEYYIYTAAKIAEKLGLPTANSIAIKNCRNKYFQNEILYKAGLNIPKTYLLDSVNQLDAEIENLPFPIIIKPIEGSGSIGVRKCNDFSTLKEHCQLLLSRQTNERGMPIDNRVLLEEFIDGDEYSAEMFNGELVGITKKYLSPPPYFVEIGHDYPAILDKHLFDIVEKSVCQAIHALNLQWGACHVEFRIRHGNVYFIEVNPRLAGDLIPELVKYSHGIDLIDSQLRVALGLPINLIKTKHKRVGIRFFVPSTSGKIQEKVALESKTREGILELKQYYKEGDYVKKCGDFRERLGHVIFDIDKIDGSKIETEVITSENEEGEVWSIKKGSTRNCHRMYEDEQRVNG